MQCLLCNKATRCSCRGGGCSGCNSNNQVVGFNNDLIKFGLDKKIIREKLKWIKTYVDKIDSFTMYEFLNWDITEEKFNEAVANYNPKAKKVTAPSGEVIWVDNPSEKCYFEYPSTWSRCKYCNWIYKFMQWKKCPAYKEKADSSVAEN